MHALAPPPLCSLDPCGAAVQAILLQTGVLGKLQPQAADVLRRLSQSMRSTAAALTLQQATNALSTMTLLGYYDVPLMAALVGKVLPEVSAAPPATIASLCYSLGLAGYSDHSLLRVRPLLCQREFRIILISAVLSSCRRSCRCRSMHATCVLLVTQHGAARCCGFTTGSRLSKRGVRRHALCPFTLLKPHTFCNLPQSRGFSTFLYPDLMCWGLGLEGLMWMGSVWGGVALIRCWGHDLEPIL